MLQAIAKLFSKDSGVFRSPEALLRGGGTSQRSHQRACVTRGKQALKMALCEDQPHFVTASQDRQTVLKYW